ncbi:hypothetical protein E3N88_16709 [Mikania micrantha]|uniref:Uncharacterized protein n=1 Tax=Mikania micrantha TaxID=192012 RepID=A0A5N6NRL7_9ASTR|nr:hypothetical protein E3N88_16709 [Mikania micrantha]
MSKHTNVGERQAHWVAQHSKLHETLTHWTWKFKQGQTIVRKRENDDERIKPIKIDLLGSSEAHRGTRWPNKRQCRDTRPTSRSVDFRNPPRTQPFDHLQPPDPCSSHWKPLKALLKLKNLEEDLLDHHPSLPPSCSRSNPRTRKCRSCSSSSQNFLEP